MSHQNCMFCQQNDNVIRYFYQEHGERWIGYAHPWCVQDYCENDPLQFMTDFKPHPDNDLKETDIWNNTKGVRPDTGEMWLTPRMIKDANEIQNMWEKEKEAWEKEKELYSAILTDQKNHIKDIQEKYSALSSLLMYVFNKFTYDDMNMIFYIDEKELLRHPAYDSIVKIIKKDKGQG